MLIGSLDISKAKRMHFHMFYVDFNEMLESNLVLLSCFDTKIDRAGEAVALREGLQISIYMDDSDADGNFDRLLAKGVVETNKVLGWAAHVKWCCRIDGDGIRHESQIRGVDQE